MPPIPRERSFTGFLKRSRFFFGTVARHKWLVLQERRRTGASWRSLILHDMDKLRPDYLWLWLVRADIEAADRLHRTRAPHMTAWWSSGGAEPTYCPMSEDALRELLADWYAAHRQNGGRDLRAWYRAHRHEVQVHPETRAWLDGRLLGAEPADGAGVPGTVPGWALVRDLRHKSLSHCAACGGTIKSGRTRFVFYRPDALPDVSRGAYCASCGPPSASPS
jgi:hypothetical protein